MCLQHSNYFSRAFTMNLNDDEDDQVQVLSNSNVQDDTNQDSTSGSHDNEHDQVASTLSQPND